MADSAFSWRQVVYLTTALLWLFSLYMSMMALHDVDQAWNMSYLSEVHDLHLHETQLDGEHIDKTSLYSRSILSLLMASALNGVAFLGLLLFRGWYG